MNLLMMMIIKNGALGVGKKTCFYLAEIYGIKFHTEKNIYVSLLLTQLTPLTPTTIIIKTIDKIRKKK
jgi:hypothetical protein